MEQNERIQMFRDVFAPKKGEKVLFLTDLPHGKIKDNSDWEDRREMSDQWADAFEKMSLTDGFAVSRQTFPASGANNAPLPDDLKSTIRRHDLVIAMTEFSATSTLAHICEIENPTTRSASMPGVNRSMEQTAFLADYGRVQRYASAIERMIKNSASALIHFSTGDDLVLDLRNRTPGSDRGDCSTAGQCINFPSGEAYIVPYEAEAVEKETFGPSQTEGILPMVLNGLPARCIVEENRIVRVDGRGDAVKGLKRIFAENESRRNIAELGIGCNPNAVVSGNVLEDEKVGLHIAYGMSTHLGGKVTSDLHEDIVYAAGCAVEGISLILQQRTDGSDIRLIDQSRLRYELLD